MKKKSNANTFITFASVTDCMTAENKARLDLAELERICRSDGRLVWLMVKSMVAEALGEKVDFKEFMETCYREYVERAVRDNIVLRSAERYIEEVSSSHVS